MQSPSGTGFVLQSLINGWNDPTIPHRNYTVLNLGQLKAVAKPFYDRLIEIGYTSAYPWPNPATPPDDYAVANLGQMKNLFSFDLTTSTANDGILDWRANAAGLGPTNPATAAALATNGPPLSPAPVPVLAVPGAAGAKANS